MQYDHEYLYSLFPDYDYRNPIRPWELHCRDNDGIRNCAWQMKAFHYWWIKNRCEKTGEIGLAFNIDNLPFCLHVDNRDGFGHIFCQHTSEHLLFNDGQFPLVITSAFIPYFPCDIENSRCDGLEVTQGIDTLSRILKQDGVLIAAIMDETGPLHEGRSLRESSQFTHAWTAKNFERSILKNISSEIWEIEEFDTFHNDMSFNIVLRKK